MPVRKYACIVALLSACLSTNLYGLESHVLENGLEVFLEEDHIVPLVTIRITFRAGAIVETAELNGLCHLYEHMLFKGNELYRSQEAFMAALKRMGAGSWNGGTSTEYVTYYITIPSDRAEEGLKFWAAAVKEPLLSREELVREREVVYNEIAGDQAEPEYLLNKAVIQALYPDYWYRRDVGGDLAVIKDATVEQMHFIKNTFYVPSNAALFISGDIAPQEIMAAVRRHYADWKPGTGFPELPPHKALKADLWVALNNSPTRGLINVTLVFRGPDAAVDPASTYAADVWGQMITDPQGRFKNRLYEEVPELYGGTRYIDAGYFTQRDAGTTSFSFILRVPEAGSLWESVTRLRAAAVGEISRMAQDDYFTPAELAAAKQELENYDILSRETAAGSLGTLSFWWASTSTEYYQAYLHNIRGVTLEAVRAYNRAYLYGRHFLTSLWIHQEDDARHGVVSRVEGITRSQAEKQ